ncbi:MAG: TIR domain-containing protein, partial [Anaerolineae bacterium]|nr:TIR domain-containing protein [Anaerolineae bacterium]
MSHIFVSHATPDDARVSAIHDALQAAGLEVWVDHEDAIGPGDNWFNQIQDALNTCRAGLFVLSRSSKDNPNCLAELISLLTLKGEGKLYIALIQPLAKEEFPWRLRTIQYVDLTGGDDALPELIAALQASRPLDPSVAKVSRRVTGSQRIDSVHRDVPISGRAAEIARVRAELRDAPVMLVSVGGRGKTRLAVALAYTSDDVSGAVWHSAAEGTTVADEVIGLLRQHFQLEDGAKRQAVLNMLGSHPTLVVIDNAESIPPERRPEYVGLIRELRDHGAQVLVTAREAWDALETAAVVHLDPLPHAVAVQIVPDMGRALKSKYDLLPHADALARLALDHPRLIQHVVKLTRNFEPEEVIRDWQGARTPDLDNALEEMLGRTVKLMTERDGHAGERLLRRITALRGTFPLEAARAVAELPEAAFKAGLSSLMTWQFVDLQTEPETRYSVDPLALEALPPDEAARPLHFTFYDELHGLGNADGTDLNRFDLIRLDFENLREALNWGFQHQTERAVDLANNLDNYVMLRESLETRSAIQWEAHAVAEKAGYLRGQANTLKALGDLALAQSDLAGARGYYDRALPLTEQIGDRLGQANTLRALGDLALAQSDLAGARGY